MHQQKYYAEWDVICSPTGRHVTIKTQEMLLDEPQMGYIIFKNPDGSKHKHLCPHCGVEHFLWIQGQGKLVENMEATVVGDEGVAQGKGAQAGGAHQVSIEGKVTGSYVVDDRKTVHEGQETTRDAYTAAGNVLPDWVADLVGQVTGAVTQVGNGGEVDFDALFGNDSPAKKGTVVTDDSIPGVTILRGTHGPAIGRPGKPGLGKNATYIQGSIPPGYSIENGKLVKNK